MTVNDAIGLLNGWVPNGLTGIQRVMLMHRVQTAACAGDKSASEFIKLCELQVGTASKH